MIFSAQKVSPVVQSSDYRQPSESLAGVSNCWNGIWNGTVEWKMEWNGECI